MISNYWSSILQKWTASGEKSKCLHFLFILYTVGTFYVHCIILINNYWSTIDDGLRRKMEMFALFFISTMDCTLPIHYTPTFISIVGNYCYFSNGYSSMGKLRQISWSDGHGGPTKGKCSGCGENLPYCRYQSGHGDWRPSCHSGCHCRAGQHNLPEQPGTSFFSTVLNISIISRNFFFGSTFHCSSWN